MKIAIKWANLAQEIYDYGSQVTFSPEGVSFENAQMPPGFVLTKWRSLTHFQSDRSQPSLPLLRRGETYYIELKARTDFPNSLYQKISFFDFSNELIAVEVIKEASGQFLYPKEAYSYTIELINAGCRSIFFQEFIITDEQAQEHPFELTWDKLSPLKEGKVGLVFLEPGTPELSRELAQSLSERGQFVAVAAFSTDALGYLTKHCEKQLREQLQLAGIKPEQITCISYGPIGNLFSLYYASRFNSHVYVTRNFVHGKVYLRYFWGTADCFRAFMSSVTAYVKGAADKVFLYGDSEEDRSLYLVQELCDTSDQLLHLPF